MKENGVLECGHEPSHHEEFTTGYGVTDNGERHCYECCAKMDREFMDSNKKITLYLVERDGKFFIENWAGSLSYKVQFSKKGGHNIAGSRLDVWFNDHHRRQWHGVQYGNNTQLCHCKKLKKQGI